MSTDLFELIKKMHQVILNDANGKPFEAKGAFWEGLLIGLEFTQDGKKKGSPLMAEDKIKDYLSQFTEYSIIKTVKFNVKKFIPKIVID